MAKVRVPIFGVGAMRVVQIERDATPGGTIGVNIYNPDGSLFDPSSAPPVESGDIPSDTDELPEGLSNLYFTFQRVYQALKDQLVAGANITLTDDDGANTITIAAVGGGLLPMVTGEIVSDQIVSGLHVTAQPVFMYFDDGSLFYVEI